ncbi:MAG: excinuclease ABC subunit UvrA [Dehalococcoidia bacterium]|nr:excinuclease ABC subunit UvrA [Dehalococcoidia bacterium]
MPQEYIHVKGAREHNLKNLDVTIPRDKLVVVTGVSGSGKSSLAFDTIYAEGQRRYVESLSAYARQFLGRMEKPDVEYIEGLSPAISIDQKGVSHNPRSTVGTVTEVYDYLRLLFARVGHPHCPKCGRPVERQTVQQIVDAILNLPEDSRIMIMAPKVRRRKGEHKEVFEEARKSGFVRVRVNGTIYQLEDMGDLALNKQKWHYIEIVVDRLIVGADMEVNRVADSVETALRHGNGVVLVDVQGSEELVFSEHFACVHCGTSLPEIEPRTFSFNSPHGACSACTGLGFKLDVDPDLIIPNKELSLGEGAIMPWVRSGTSSGWYKSLIESVAKAHNFSTKVPVKDLPEDALNLIMHGNSGKSVTMRHKTHSGHVYSWETNFEGVIPNLERRHRETQSDYMRNEIERYMTAQPCVSCNGRRLRPEALAVRVCGMGIMDVCALTIDSALGWTQEIASESPGGELDYPAGPPPAGASRRGAEGGPRQGLSPREMTIARQILKEIEARLKFLTDIGLDYLSLSRSAQTLSGGEAQRIRLATQIGSGLTGVLYVCDEPTVGLHPVDDTRLIETLKRLRELGNTVVVVEHDEAVMQAADYIVDLGPGAGEHGGQVVATGTMQDVMDCSGSITGNYLSGKRRIPIPEKRRHTNEKHLLIKGARENNLKDEDVKVPLGLLVCVTGVSGSGKSTLVYEILYKKLAQLLYRGKDKPGLHDAILGVEHIDKVVNIDQSPIGRTPRSNPATYTGTFTPIRELFSNLPEAKMRGYAPGRFSFNVRGGRCEACQGEGYIQIEMQFLPDVTVPCEVCHGQRYNREALEVLLREKSIADVLDMTVEQAVEFFWNFPKIRSKLETLRDVGLGYIRLGQPATTLSGGEAQRVKLATELSRRATGKTIYILDEPTTGRSFEDCAALLRVQHRLEDAGNSVVLIEHHLDMMKNADWIIDLGPGAGDKGGQVIATGTPEDVMRTERSYTGQYLSKVLGGVGETVMAMSGDS